MLLWLNERGAVIAEFADTVEPVTVTLTEPQVVRPALEEQTLILAAPGATAVTKRVELLIFAETMLEFEFEDI